MAATGTMCGEAVFLRHRRCFVLNPRPLSFFYQTELRIILSRIARTRLASMAPRALTAGAPVRALHATRARLADEPASAGGLTFTMTVPTKSLYEEAAVEMVILPGGDGMFGVMPSHVPTISELKPGTISVQETAGGELTKYFISGGFASGAQTVAPPVSPPS